MVGFLELGLMGVVPVVVSVILYIIQKKTKFSRLSFSAQQIIIGIIFGIIAALGTDFGVNINGATMNARDAAPIAAGLIFGAPAGVIAGLIGGIHRFFAVYWGAGAYTQIACTISTCLAGIIAATLRKTVFGNRITKWYYGWAVGLAVEVLHMLMVFITNNSDVYQAFAVVQVCTIPMITVNSLSVLLSVLVVKIIEKRVFKEGINIVKSDKLSLAILMQRWLIGIVIFCFVGTNAFTYLLQEHISVQSCESLLELNLEDAKQEVISSTNKSLLEIAHNVTKEIESGDYDLVGLANKYDITDINIVDKDGIIVQSNNNTYLGYEMFSKQQSSEFKCLVEGTKEYVQEYQKMGFDETNYRKYAGVSLSNEIGFVQIGCDAISFQSFIGDGLKNITSYRHIGDEGFMIVLDANFMIISSPLGEVGSYIGEDQITSEGELLQDSLLTIELEGNKFYCMFKETEGYTLVALRPKAEVEFSRNLSLYIQSFLEIIVFGLLFLLLYGLIDVSVIKKVKNVCESLDKIASGNLTEKLNAVGCVEFEDLSKDINATVDTLKEYIAKEATRIDKELQFAQAIQHSTLPNTFPAFPSMKDIFDIHATMNTAKEVGGDFYDFYFIDNDHLAILIADVSGKGIPAAMFMMTAKTIIKSFCMAGLPIEEVMSKANQELCAHNEAGMFVTTWLGFLNIKTGCLEFVNAGHNPPAIKKDNGKYEFLKSKVGLVLAGMEGIKYKKQETILKPGEDIYLYTDGVTEATNEKEELYSEARLLDVLNNNLEATSKDICLSVKKSVDEFVGAAPQFDDITMLSLKYFGSSTIFELEVDATTPNVDVVTDFVDEKLEELGANMKVVNQVNIAIDELFSNIVKYAYPEGTIGKASIRLTYANDIIHLAFIDSGMEFNPLLHADPDTTLSVEERGIGGLGILMVKNMMDDVTYEYLNNKNVLTIVKKLK